MSQLNAVKMTYAKSGSGEIVCIDDVENGLGCNCFCLDCGGQLKARQGAIKQWHFSHHKENDADNCQWSGESEIHMKVKEYLDRHRKLTVPIGFTRPTSFVIHFDDIQLEKSLRPTKRIPDVTGYCSGEKVLIEVKVTHEVDLQKRIDYKKANVSVVELDFSDFTPIGDRVTDQDIERHLERTLCAWLSVAPVGDIAMRIQDHERAESKKIIEENNKLLHSNKILNNDANYLVNYINSYSYRYEECKKRINDAATRLSVIRNEIHQTKFVRNTNVDAAESAFLNTLQQLEQNHLIKLDRQNLEHLERLRERFIGELKAEHHDLIEDNKALNELVNSKRIELEQIQFTIEGYDAKAKGLLEKEKNLNEGLENFRKKEQDWIRAAKANAVIKRHFVRLEPELRELCRKGGIPWPFNGSLMSELSPDKDAG